MLQFCLFIRVFTYKQQDNLISSNLSFSSNRCFACSPSAIFIVSNGVCVCQSGYPMVNSTCTSVIGCASATEDSNGQSICTACDTSLNYDATIVNNVCECADGFYFDPLNTT